MFCTQNIPAKKTQQRLIHYAVHKFRTVIPYLRESLKFKMFFFRTRKKSTSHNQTSTSENDWIVRMIGSWDEIVRAKRTTVTVGVAFYFFDSLADARQSGKSDPVHQSAEISLRPKTKSGPAVACACSWLSAEVEETRAALAREAEGRARAEARHSLDILFWFGFPTT